MESHNIVRDDWNGYNVLHDSASRVGALDLGFLKSASASKGDAKTKFVYLLGSDDYPEEEVPQDAFVVYQVSTLFTFFLTAFYPSSRFDLHVFGFKGLIWLLNIEKHFYLM